MYSPAVLFMCGMLIKEPMDYLFTSKCVLHASGICDMEVKSCVLFSYKTETSNLILKRKAYS